MFCDVEFFTITFINRHFGDWTGVESRQDKRLSTFNPRRWWINRMNEEAEKAF